MIESTIKDFVMLGVKSQDINIGINIDYVIKM